MARAQRSKIAFFQGDSHPTHDTVRKQLQARFPEKEIVAFNVREMLKRHPFFALLNTLHMVGTYGMSGLRRRRDLIDCFIQTPAAFRFIKKQLSGAISPSELYFTFQDYSMWDGSRAGVPHFVYTDNCEMGILGYPGFDRSRLIGPWWTELEKTIYHNARRVFTMSSNVTRLLREEYGCAEDRVSCVGVGCNAPASATFRDDLERYQAKVVIFVGTVWENKGGPELVAAFQKILPRHPTARLKIVGCSPEISAPNCDVLGRLPLPAVQKEYENASLFCLPTWRESFGISYIEAMSAGLPVIGSDFGAIPDFIIPGETGFRINPGDVDGLAAKMSCLLDSSEEMRALGRRGAALARATYTWDKVGERMSSEIVHALASN